MSLRDIDPVRPNVLKERFSFKLYALKSKLTPKGSYLCIIMPQDIFISYSRKDSVHALLLAEKLRAESIGVWIDQHGIAGAEKWATEIVEGIKGCSTFILLISPDSVASENVLRELSLANESRKRILPVEIQRIELPSSFMYPLTGLQRVRITDFEKILHAHKYGIGKIIKKDERKSLMILPFEDLSPTGDNAWFADGIASEMVSTLSNIKSLRLIDWNSSRILKNRSIKTVELAKEFEVRYFIEGQVRKFGDQIKISITLLDIETADHLWQDSLKGTMQDIFEIQETVAKKVIAGLDIILSKEEQKTLDKKPTENTEAYELFLKGIEYFERSTHADYGRAIQLYEDAIRLDPDFGPAFRELAIAQLGFYRLFSRNPTLLSKAEQAIERMREILGEKGEYYYLMSILLLRRGNAEGAKAMAQRSVEAYPAYSEGYRALGQAYQALSKKKEAVDAYRQLVRLRDTITTRSTLIMALHELGETESLQKEADLAIPIFKKHIRLNPDAFGAKATLILILQYAGHREAAQHMADELSMTNGLGQVALYNLACVYLQLNMKERGMGLLVKSIADGFKNIELLYHDPDLNLLRGTPEFDALVRDLERKIAEDMNG